MSKPRLLDAFSGAGGACKGYQRAGFYVVGVDHKPQPRYCGDEFVLGDALEYIKAHGHEFDAIHASPPCQGYSIMRNLPWLRHKEYPLLIQPTADALNVTGVPWVIENVMGAKLASGWLCGTMFGLPFFRHRFFWTGAWFWLQPPHAPHTQRIRPGHSLAGRARDIVFPNGAQADGCAIGHAKGARKAALAMGVDWMKREEITQAIPPSYTEFIGKQLMTSLAVKGA